METGHDSRAVANEILLIGQEKGIPMSMMKLIKLVYFAHGWKLGLKGEPLCSDPAESWRYGPVFRKLYGSLPYRGDDIVKFPVKDGKDPVISSFNNEDMEILNSVVDTYGSLHAFQLSDITHKEGSPWEVTMKKGGTFAVIDNKLLEEFYKV